MSVAFMVQGTGSDVGKSLIVAGLCRAFTRRGLSVRPFKPQNMSNNAAVTVECGEIGRAQALQARACGVMPTLDMNPILLKPESERGAQIILRGRRATTLSARDYFSVRARFMPMILESFNRLGQEADLVIVEGAGSPAEVNLRSGDLANMGFATAADLPVLLVGDIHRGGVIASVIGTMEVLPREDARRIKAFLINNFRGDPTLFDGGVRFIEQRSGIVCAGVVPYFPDAGRLPAEDAVALEHVTNGKTGLLHIAMPRLSRIANFDDLDPLRLHPGVKVSVVHPGDSIPADVDLVILPGSKSTMNDLAFLRAQGWDIDILAHVRRGGRVLGLCAGYQMLGRMLHDPDGIEGEQKSVPGLGLLDVETVLSAEKRLTNVTALHVTSGCLFSAYEMHLGRSAGPDCARPFARIGGMEDGARSADGLVEGTYLHGLFANDVFRLACLRTLNRAIASGAGFEALVEQTLDHLADHLCAHVDLDRLLDIAHGRSVSSVHQVSRSGAVIHGGDLADARRLAGVETRADDWLDLSTGINPHAYPVGILSDASWRRLPGRADLARLQDVARIFYRLPDATTPVVIPGTEILINLLPRLFSMRRVQIIGPTYGSHGLAWTRAGHVVEEIGSLDEADPMAIVILVNPNNPDGREVSMERLSLFVDAVRSANGLLIVDEAYGEMAPHLSAVPLCAVGPVIVLRSFGKFFGLSGLRLGFAIAATDLASRLALLCGEWPVSGPALSIGAAALSDTDWHLSALQRIAALDVELSGLLSRWRINVVGNVKLFRLIETDSASALFDHLLDRRVYTRVFPERETWLRLGLPGCPAELERLDEALSSWR